ncbi:MAG: LysR family transcriptional regulator [Ornithinimicrobium sp.]
MELRTIRYFVAVADAGSVTSAATQVHITQPSLSRQVRSLERELGLTLFSRVGGRLILTTAGRTFLPTARELLQKADSTRDAARDIGAGRLQSISILAPTATLTDVVAPFIATFDAQDPMPAVGELRPGTGYGALGRGADLVLSALPPSQEFAHARIARLPILAYVRPEHVIAALETIALPDLIEHDLLLLTPQSHVRWTLDAQLASDSLGYHNVKEFTSSRVAQAVAAAGRGVAVVSDDPRFGLRGVPIATSNGSLRLNLYAAWRPGHHAATTLESFADRLSRYVVSRYGSDVAPLA